VDRPRALPFDPYPPRSAEGADKFKAFTHRALKMVLAAGKSHIFSMDKASENVKVIPLIVDVKST
jgi:hypothetical protein